MSIPLITSAKSLLPCQITYSQVLGIRVWVSLEGDYLKPTAGTDGSYGRQGPQHGWKALCVCHSQELGSDFSVPVWIDFLTSALLFWDWSQFLVSMVH